ncbi:hypothetical protein [Nitrosomonas oligotropha]|uniref:Uncharacterized protein n=1 Tax=Nitrosomonas oligotropha TaxID=42354 RepID=A0A1H8PTF8_9PROT|nr:hypothetical protein [Nitrosomonas oligotropha]SDW65237.1 hypothetical protein SAMN05216300_10819 [Nitrosomonas oligotropha]SEO45289.1 hypothetical protein SAMN05216333_11019 [Nitrosomonas oligotropha]
MSHTHFTNQIAKTGFVLENRIAQELKAAKWTVISNRYYVDDAEESVREIDLIAYQATRVQHFDVYTTLIISCKKNETNAWALLARDIDLKDPNSDWQPLHAWSNDKALAYQLSSAGFAKRYHDGIAKHGVITALQTPAVEVFAFQEMKRDSGVPQNDKNIFTAVTSLMKAQAYELGALPQRKKTPAIYQFNLLSIVDADLFRLMFSGRSIEAIAVESEHYIARYIIKKRETFSRIRFLHANAFAGALPDYSTLHSANCQWFGSECDAFYRDIAKDGNRLNILLEEFRKQAAWEIRWPLFHNNIKAPDAASINLYWNRSGDSLNIWAPFGTEGASLLNGNVKTKKVVADTLQSIYRYSGPFVFEDDDIHF